MVTTRDAKPDAHDITCRQAVSLMTDYLDGALGPDDRALMEAHHAECESCAEHLRQIRITVAVTGRIREEDLGPAEDRLRMFLEQYWGGPRTYDELRGHPRLRMRHARFAIGEAERDAWLHHMRVALDEFGLDEALAAQLWDYLVMAAHSLVNVDPARGRPDLGLKPA